MIKTIEIKPEKLNMGQLSLRIYEIGVNGGDWKNSPEYSEFKHRCPGFREFGK